MAAQPGAKLCGRLVAIAVVAGACATERARPLPTDAAPAALTVRIVRPPDGAPVAAGADLEVIVEGRDREGSRLAGVGLVARRAGSGGSATLDSTAVRFAGIPDSTHGFVLPIPASLPANTRIDLLGIAYGPGGQTARSAAVSVLVIRPVTARARLFPLDGGGRLRTHVVGHAIDAGHLIDDAR